MIYEEIKMETKKAIENQKTITDRELELLHEAIDELIYNEKNGIGELVSYVEDVQIYDYTKKMIPKTAEPRKIKEIITNLRYELSRPEKVREHIEYNL